MCRLIDADALNLSMMLIAPGETKKYCYPCREILKEIDDAPTIDPVRKGKWTHKSGTLFATCSECGVVWGAYVLMNYCPNCGAKMEEGEHDG